LAFGGRGAAFEKHFDYFQEIVIEFIEGCALGMSAGKTWDVADEETGVSITFNDGGKGFHKIIITRLRDERRGDWL
jgi:hypothetical protein